MLGNLRNFKTNRISPTINCSNSHRFFFTITTNIFSSIFYTIFFVHNNFRFFSITIIAPWSCATAHVWIKLILNSLQHHVTNRIHTFAHYQGLRKQSVQAFHAHRHTTCTHIANMLFTISQRNSQCMTECQIILMRLLILLLNNFVRLQQFVKFSHKTVCLYMRHCFYSFGTC